MAVLGAPESVLGSLVLGSSSPSLTQNLSHTLGLSAFTGTGVSTSNTLFMSGSAIFVLLIDDFKSINQNLGLGHTVDAGTAQFLSQNLSITHTVDVVNFGPITQNLGISHFASFVGPIPVSASNTLSMSHVVALAREELITQTLGLTHIAVSVQKHELNLTHIAMGYLNASPFFFQELNIGHTVQVSAAYVLNPAHTNVVTQAITFFIDDGSSCPRNDFQDLGTLGPEPFTVASGAKLVFSNITGTDDLVLLRNPELDDRDRIGFTRINREGQGGELQVFRDPTWPLVNTVQGTVIGLKKTDVDDWLQFTEDHLGEEISMADWHGRYWRGVIINVDEPVVEDTRDRWTLAFEFEGVEMPGPDIFQQVGIGHVLAFTAIWNRPVAQALGLSQTVDPGLANVHHDGFNVTHDGFEVFHTT